MMKSTIHANLWSFTDNLDLRVYPARRRTLPRGRLRPPSPESAEESSFAERLAPTCDVQDDAVTRDVMLNAHVEVVSKLVEDPTSPLSGQVIECANPDATVR